MYFTGTTLLRIPNGTTAKKICLDKGHTQPPATASSEPCKLRDYPGSLPRADPFRTTELLVIKSETQKISCGTALCCNLQPSGHDGTSM